MAKLDKIQIVGIRSFGPFEDRVQQLQFTSPVTLIVGQNGCGKTTIIEAIRFACTAELPAGTDSGRGFVHDPKINRRSSTLAQVKLRIIDPKGNNITIARVVEVRTTGTGPPKFSSKPPCIRMVSADGVDTSLPGRCADVSAECCQIMNVSPAVLSNVIFCHQENSAWPLDEGKKLKEKFDEIFEADRYKTCVDNFRKLIKTKNDSIKLLTLELSYRKDKLEQVEKQRRNLQHKEDSVLDLENNIARKNSKLEPIKKRIDEIFELEKVLSDLQTELTTKEATRKGVIQEQSTIKESIQFEFDGSDTELRSRITDFEKDREKDVGMIGELEKRQRDLDSKSEVIVNAIQESQIELGKLNQEKLHNEQRCVQRGTLINKAQAVIGLPADLDCEDNERAKSALYELKTELENAEMGLAMLEQEKLMEETKLQKQIDDVRVKATRAEQELSSKAKAIREAEEKSIKITNDLGTISVSVSSLKTFGEKLDNVDSTMHRVTENFRETEQTQKMEKSKNAIYALEQTLSRLESEYKVLQQNDVIEGKLEGEKLNLVEKQQGINNVRTKHSEGLKHLFGDAIPEENLKDAVLTLQTRAENLVKITSENINKKQKDVTTLETQRQFKMHEVVTCEKELKLKSKQISQACNGRDFNESLKTSYDKKEKLQTDRGQYGSLKIIYEQFIQKFQKESPCCPVCRTDFTGKSALVQKIIDTLKNTVHTVPQQLSQTENELKKEESLYNKLQQLKFVNDEVKTLQEKLPKLKTDLEQIDVKLNDSKTELEQLKVELLEPQKVSNVAKAMILDVTLLDQSQLDIKRSNNTIDDLTKGLVKVDSGNSKQEVETEIEDIKSQIVYHRHIVETQIKKISKHKDLIQQLTNERSSLAERKYDLAKAIQGKPVLENQKKELDEMVDKLKQEVASLDATLTTLQSQLKDASENKANVVKKYSNQIEAERTRNVEFSNLLQTIEKLQENIDQYLTEKLDEKLQSVEQELSERKNKHVKLNETKTTILQAISSKKQDIAKQEANFQTFKSNVTLREKKAIEKELNEEIRSLQIKIGGHNYKSVYEEKRRLISERETLEKEINTVTGEKNSLQHSIEELQLELSKPENKKARNFYLSKFYELKVTKYAVSDLNNYVANLERAVIDFHKTKMAHINKNIRELWRDVYRGNDIDYIEIKTEHPTQQTARRTYNYKVVQIKKGVELDMRGRCSAGQKVLACLIIRIALADTLSSNCGILALDEPTTNLDKDNIHSLCDTLSRIINTRREEQNFQLIIITHDEEFINNLTRSQGVDHFYRVTRDNDGFSVINKEYAL